MAASITREGTNDVTDSLEGHPLGRETGQTEPNSPDFGQDVMNSIHSISQPVEMSDLSNKAPNETPLATVPLARSQDIPDQSAARPVPETSPHAPAVESAGPQSTEEVAVVSESGIGPATDRPTAQTTILSEGPQLVITLLLHSTETRHPYSIDEGYLKRRNVNVVDNNPINMTVYTLKELILRDWRSEWETRPTSPTSIRLIHMGRMLDDKVYLKDSRFSNGNTPHIVHMTIKPQDAIDEEDARIAKGGGRERDGSERSPGCRCTIM